MRNQYRQDPYRSERQQGRNDQSYRRQGRERGERGERNDWYERDPMDERSGYRDEEDRDNSRRMESSDTRGYNDHYRYDQNYHSYYGSPEYSPDRERGNESEGRRGSRRGESSYDSDRYNRGQGAYGSSGSDRSTWDTGMQSNDSFRTSGHAYSRLNEGGEYGRRGEYEGGEYGGRSSSSQYGSSDYGASRGGYGSDRTSERTSYGATQGSWSPSGESRSSFFGRGPKNYQRSDERIKEEICEMLTRHSAIDADEIDVEVKDGEVTLTGSVSERRMKHLAEDAAEQCYGVKDVVNNIRVKRSQESDRDVSERSESGTGSREKNAGSSSSKRNTGSTSNPQNPSH